MKFIFFLFDYFPFFPITMQRGGAPVSRASWRGLNMLLFVCILGCCVGGIFLLGLYRKHPLLGKWLLILLAVIGVWSIVRYLFTWGKDDPLLRKTPCRPLELPEETLPDERIEPDKK